MSEAALPPSAEDQVRFLSGLQRLLEETRTTSTYKFALLLALADLSVEHGDGTGAPLLVSTDQIAAKFVTYYWPHALPYDAACGPIIIGPFESADNLEGGADRAHNAAPPAPTGREGAPGLPLRD